MQRLNRDFFMQDALALARALLGKVVVRVWSDDTVSRFRITETEAYFGSDDKACHAAKGRTSRTEIMFAEGGYIYVYLIYGMHWMLNIVSGKKDFPQAVLICGVDEISGSGRVGKLLKIDKSFYGENLMLSQRIWIEDAPEVKKYETCKRKGVDYAGLEWSEKQWRFIAKNY